MNNETHIATEKPETVDVGSDGLLAVFHVQNPLMGDVTPIMRAINERTTVAELMDWHRRNCLQPQLWKESWFDVRLLPSSR